MGPVWVLNGCIHQEQGTTTNGVLGSQFGLLFIHLLGTVQCTSLENLLVDAYKAEQD